MNVLYLTNERNASCLPRFIGMGGDFVAEITGKVDVRLVDELDIGFVVSHNYRHVIGEDVIGRMGGRIVNLHISYLPWNRGADPNLWSWVDGTPKGVTIHFVDEGIDTGDIVAQAEVEFKQNRLRDETLWSTYVTLQEKMEELFTRNWAGIRAGEVEGKRQERRGSFHRSVDKEMYRSCMPDGWLTRIDDFLRNVEEKKRILNCEHKEFIFPGSRICDSCGAFIERRGT